jgi:hypothetical protein
MDSTQRIISSWTTKITVIIDVQTIDAEIIKYSSWRVQRQSWGHYRKLVTVFQKISCMTQQHTTLFWTRKCIAVSVMVWNCLMQWNACWMYFVSNWSSTNRLIECSFSFIVTPTWPLFVQCQRYVLMSSWSSSWFVVFCWSKKEPNHGPYNRMKSETKKP